MRTLAGPQLIGIGCFGTSVGDNDGDGFFFCFFVCAACARSGAAVHATAEVAPSHDIFTAVVIHPSVGGVAGQGLSGRTAAVCSPPKRRSVRHTRTQIALTRLCTRDVNAGTCKHIAHTFTLIC